MCDYCCSLKGDLNKHFRRKHTKKDNNEISSEVTTNNDGIEIKPKLKNTRKTSKNTDEIFLYP